MHTWAPTAYGCCLLARACKLTWCIEWSALLLLQQINSLAIWLSSLLAMLHCCLGAPACCLPLDEETGPSGFLAGQRPHAEGYAQSAC